MILVGRKGKRYSPKFQFQVVLEVLKGDRDAVEIARAYDLHPTTVTRWKRQFLENGAAVFGKDAAVAACVRMLFAQPDAEAAQEQSEKVASAIEQKLPWAAEFLLSAQDDVLAHKAFRSSHWRQLHSTNPLERVNRKIGRWSDVVTIFPDADAALRPVSYTHLTLPTN